MKPKKVFEKFKNWPSAIALFFVASVVIGAGVQQQFPTDLLKMGIGTSSDDKKIEIDTGDGASNPSIVVDMTNKDFDFNKALNIVGDLTAQGQFQMGTGAGADQTIEFDIGLGAANPKIRWSNTDQALQFANDGVNYRNIGAGSGGGGGVNFLADFNSDFEAADPPSNWSSSGGTFVAETTSPLLGKQSGKWDPSAAAQTLSSATVLNSPGFLGSIGQRCQAEILYKWPSGVAGEIQMKVIDQLSQEVLALDLNPTTGDNSQLAQAMFDCGDAVGDGFLLRLEAVGADPAEIIVDNAFLGFGKNTIQISQAEQVGQINFPTGCAVVSTNTSMVQLPSSTCTPNVSGNLETIGTPGVDVRLGVRITNAKPGRYVVSYSTTPQMQTVTTNGRFIQTQLFRTDGVDAPLADPQSSRLGNAGIGGNPWFVHSASGVAEITTAGQTVEFQIYGRAGAADSPIVVSETDIVVNRYPLESAEAITLETVASNWSGYHDNDCTWLNAGATLDDFPVGDASCTFGETYNSSFGTVTSWDDGANPLPGIKFTPTSAGVFWVCAMAEYTHSAAAASSQAVRMVDESGNVIATNNGLASTSGQNASNLCGFVRASSVTEKTIKFQGYANAGSVQIGYSQTVASGTRSVEWSIFKINQQFPTPIFTDLTDSLDSKLQTGTQTNLTSCFFRLLSSETPVLNQDQGGCVQSLVDTGAAAFAVNFVPGFFSVSPVCVCSAINGALSSLACTKTTASPSTVSFATWLGSSGGVRSDAGISVHCVGQK